jgi:hypothetical protein
VANEWKSAVVKRMTDGVAYLFKVNGVTWVRGTGTFTDAHTLAVTGGENVTFTSAILATGSSPWAGRSTSPTGNPLVAFRWQRFPWRIRPVLPAQVEPAEQEMKVGGIAVLVARCSP